MATKAGSSDKAVKKAPAKKVASASGLEVTPLDKASVPKTEMAPALQRRLAELQALEERPDRVLSVTSTPIGQVLYANAAVSGGRSASEIDLAVGDVVHRIEAPSPAKQQHDRARVDASADGWLLITHRTRKLVLEVNPVRGERREICHVPFETGGTIEAARVKDGIVVSTTDGLFLVTDPSAPTLDAFLPAYGFKHICLTPDGRGIVICFISREDASAVALVAVNDRRLELVQEVATAKPPTEPQVHAGRVVARQGKAWLEIRGIELPTIERVDTVAALKREADARLAEGKSALVPVAGRSLPRAAARTYDGQRVVAACATPAGEVLAVDGGDRNHLIVLPAGGAPIRIESAKVFQYPDTLDASPDGQRVIASGFTGSGFVPCEIVVSTCEVRSIPDASGSWIAPSYLSDQRIVRAHSDMVLVHDLANGQVAARAKLAPAMTANAMVVSKNRSLLVRANDGSVAYVRTRGGEIEHHEHIVTRAAAIAADGDDLLAMVDGVTCKLVMP